MPNIVRNQSHRNPIAPKELYTLEELARGKGDGIAVDVGGSISGGIGLNGYDYISVAYPSATTEVYTYRSGGASGTIVNTVVTVYTDATKNRLHTMTKTE